jgi:hypothetical protein
LRRHEWKVSEPNDPAHDQILDRLRRRRSGRRPEGELKIHVDVTTRDGLHPMLWLEIEQTAVRVF